MSGKIFLSGGGNQEETYKLDDLFLKGSGEKILYLPVGLKRTFAGYDGCVEWFENMIKSHNIEKKITTWVNLKGKKDLIKIDNFDAIYIGGASDTYRLHCLFLKYNIYESFMSFLSDGGYIYGGSGGATVLGKTINYDQLDKGLDLIESLSANLIFNYSIFTHLSDEKLKKISKLDFGDVIVLSEKGGVVLDRKKREVKYVGDENGVIISGDFSKKIFDEELIKI